MDRATDARDGEPMTVLSNDNYVTVIRTKHGRPDLQ